MLGDNLTQFCRFEELVNDNDISGETVLDDRVVARC